MRKGITSIGSTTLLLAVSHASGGVLGDLAASMQPGTFVQVPNPANINAVLGATGSSSTDFGYTDDIVWDPVTRQAFFLGGDHGVLAQFNRYSESSNSWVELPRPSWMPSSTMHGYDHSAIDPQRRFLYHRPFNSNAVHRYHIDTGQWTTLPAPPPNGTSCCDALEYFPDLGLVWAHQGYGHVLVLREGATQWDDLADPAGTSSFQHAEYNPVHNVLLFHLGSNLYQLDADRQITSLGTVPVSLYDGTGSVGIMTVDPVGGDFLLLTAEQRQLYIYDVTTRTHRLAPVQWPSSISNKPDVATPLASDGVTLFVYCQEIDQGQSECGMVLYKHTGASSSVPPQTPTQFRVN